MNSDPLDAMAMVEHLGETLSDREWIRFKVLIGLFETIADNPADAICMAAEAMGYKPEHLEAEAA